MTANSADQAGAGGTYGLRLLRDPAFLGTAATLLILIVLAFRAVQFAFFTTQIQWGYDFSAYWLAASHLLDGQAVYSAEQLSGPYAPQAQYLYLYPPSLAAAVIPFALLFPDDYRTAAWVWALLGGVIVAAVVLAVGRREGVFDSGRFGDVVAGKRRWFAVGLAFTLPPVIGELVLGNVHLLILGMFAIAWLGVRSESPKGDRIAGIAIGVATVVKVFPAVIVLWFLLSGRRTAAIWAAVGAAGTALVTLPVTGIQPWLDYPTVLANLSAPSDTTDTLAPTVWLTPILGFAGARVVVTTLALGMVVWAATRRPTAIGFAVAVIASVLIAPALYHHYLAILVLPFLLAAAHLRGRAIWIGVAYLLLWGGSQPALGDLEWVVNRAMPTLGVLGLLVALLMGPRPPIPAKAS